MVRDEELPDRDAIPLDFVHQYIPFSLEAREHMGQSRTFFLMLTACDYLPLVGEHSLQGG